MAKVRLLILAKKDCTISRCNICFPESNAVQLQNASFKFDVVLILCIQSDTRENLQNRGQKGSKPVCEIWCNNLDALLRNRIFRGAVFFSATPCTLTICRCNSANIHLGIVSSVFTWVKAIREHNLS